MFDVKLMRWIDNQVGNLACTALATAKRIGAPFRKDTVDYKKIVVTKFFGMGSIIVASPALQALREAYPDAEIHFVSFRSNKEILEILGLTDKNWFVDVSTPAAFAASVLTLARDLRAEKFDLMIDFEFFAKFPLVLAGLAGVPKKAGFYLTKEPWRRTLLDVSGSYNHYFHTKDIFVSLVYLLTTGDLFYLDFEDFRRRYAYPRVEIEPAAREHVERLLTGLGIGSSRTFVINPNTSADLAPEVRKWPVDRYVDLARQLLRENPGASVVFIGAKSERAYVEGIVSSVDDPRAVSLAGELSLRQLLALFERAELFVTNDSGPMHLACLVDAPIVGLFFADTPTVYGPVASRTATVSPPLYSIPLFTVYNGKDVVAGRPVDTIDNTAARSVTVERVLEECRSLLAAPSSAIAAAAPIH
ncbi:MAG: glycosyltransferase family 9 protein [Labilithrix sp.]|nr:glycosyltransferase family 9 protein [Labilithrix sp.]MCW5835407.1 glycosyltransferase family 9 protein [Labilithrix sp.]